MARQVGGLDRNVVWRRVGRYSARSPRRSSQRSSILSVSVLSLIYRSSPWFSWNENAASFIRDTSKLEFGGDLSAALRERYTIDSGSQLSAEFGDSGVAVDFVGFDKIASQ